jgi:hypothetical protein
MVRVGGLYLSMEKETKTHQSGTGFFVHHTIVLAVKRTELVSDRVSYMRVVLRGCWYNFRVLNVHAPSEEESMIK